LQIRRKGASVLGSAPLGSHSLHLFGSFVDVTSLLPTLLIVVAVYFAIGIGFAIPFVLIGAPRLDPAAKGSRWSFRVIIMPGVALFWPLLAWRWWSGRPVVEKNAHRDRAGGTAP